MKEKKIREFRIKLQGNVMTISTDQTKRNTLETILNLIFKEFYKFDPEAFEKYAKKVTALLSTRLNKNAPKEADEEPLDDFEFWRNLMERRG
ncbi:hypothetical protein [Gorillibacterium timonense]|uniref:hypothetical protein n=1 Tax=Gorillibacterium timonense TaxID=1689269 RepID=UPI00071E5592|nr:hypothetical protein [Gorillibacterium timonense]